MSWKTIKEAAEELGVSDEAIAGQIKSGHLRARGSGEHVMVSLDAPRSGERAEGEEEATALRKNAYGEDMGRVREWGYFQTALGSLSQTKKVFQEDAKRARKQARLARGLALVTASVAVVAVAALIGVVMSYHADVRQLASQAAYREGEAVVLRDDLQRERDLLHRYLPVPQHAAAAVPPLPSVSPEPPEETAEHFRARLAALESELAATQVDRDRFLEKLLALSREQATRARQLAAKRSEHEARVDS
jgi:hypothetical protein